MDKPLERMDKPIEKKKGLRGKHFAWISNLGIDAVIAEWVESKGLDEAVWRAVELQ